MTIKKSIRPYTDIIVIFSLAILGIAIISYVDLVIRPEYWTKTLIKAPIFLLTPFAYKTYKKDYKPTKAVKTNARGLKKSILLGISIYAIIVATYLVVNLLFDLSQIETALSVNLGINKNNFLVIGAYVAIVNSFLEEWFFRGFIFAGVKHRFRLLAYVLSPLLFAFYHVAMMDSMFSAWMLCLVLVGLSVGGIIFNFLYESNNNLYAPWLCHMFANLAMNTVGILIFF